MRALIQVKLNRNEPEPGYSAIQSPDAGSDASSLRDTVASCTQPCTGRAVHGSRFPSAAAIPKLGCVLPMAWEDSKNTQLKASGPCRTLFAPHYLHPRESTPSSLLANLWVRKTSTTWSSSWGWFNVATSRIWGVGRSRGHSYLLLSLSSARISQSLRTHVCTRQLSLRLTWKK